MNRFSLKCVTFAAMGMLVVAGFGGPAHADDVQPAVAWGDVITPAGIDGLVIAKDLSFNPNGQGGSCDVWNKDGGSTSKFLDSHNNCTTASMRYVAVSWLIFLDTDVFTVQHEAYWVLFGSSWRRVPANVYTRIHGWEQAECWRQYDGVNCLIRLG